MIYNYATHGPDGYGQPYHSTCDKDSKAQAIREARLSYDEEYGLKRGIVFKFWNNDGTVKFEHVVAKLSLLQHKREKKCVRCGKAVARRNLCWKHYRQQMEWEELTPFEQKAVLVGQQIAKKFDRILVTGGRSAGKSKLFEGIESRVTTGNG